MIKNDYKPRKPSEPIFSEKKGFPRAPVIMVSISIFLVIWGLTNSLMNSDDAEATTEVTDIPVATVDQTAEETEEKRRFEIPLNLGGNDADSPAQTPVKQPTPVAKSEVIQIKATQQALTEVVKEPSLNWKTSKIKPGCTTRAIMINQG